VSGGGTGGDLDSSGGSGGSAGLALERVANSTVTHDVSSVRVMSNVVIARTDKT
jgi:hypothetical protein